MCVCACMWFKRKIIIVLIIKVEVTFVHQQLRYLTTWDLSLSGTWCALFMILGEATA